MASTARIRDALDCVALVWAQFVLQQPRKGATIHLFLSRRVRAGWYGATLQTFKYRR
jgi:uncharacterized membrane-anchored protein